MLVDIKREWPDRNGQGGTAGQLLSSLARLDRLLLRAAERATAVYGAHTVADRFRGLYVSGEEVERLLGRRPGAPLLYTGGGDSHSGREAASTRLGWLGQICGLEPFEVDVLLIALAPEVDRRYERMYAYLQDHVSHGRPSVDLALNLLCANAGERLERRRHFAADAPLRRRRLLHLVPAPGKERGSLLADQIHADPQIVQFLLGQRGLEDRLAKHARFHAPTLPLASLPMEEGVRERLIGLAGRAQAGELPLFLAYSGRPGAGRRQAAAALAAELDARLLVVEMGPAAEDGDFEEMLGVAFRAAFFEEAHLYLDGLGGLAEGQRATLASALAKARQEPLAPEVIAMGGAWTASSRHIAGVVPLHFPLPGYEQRRHTWRRLLDEAGIGAAPDVVDVVARRFRLNPGQIANAVARAASEPSGGDSLARAAREQSGHELARLARRVEPVYEWADIVVPADTLAQLYEICWRVEERARVLDDWGFGRRLPYGTGTSALFAGPSGTGKTMAAQIIASELGLELYAIDLSGVVSKYIGETEKNLARIFEAAEGANAILFFDEADALFGKRSEVRDSHDRYANIEISYLLQRMEAHDGVTILATNLRQNLDDSFLRRLAFTVHFPFPDGESRRRIWRGIWPAGLPLAESVDLEALAERFPLSGGNIKNVALAASFLAAPAGGPVTMEHLAQAIRREYQKMGKTLLPAEMALPPAAANGTGKARR